MIYLIGMKISLVKMIIYLQYNDLVSEYNIKRNDGNNVYHACDDTTLEIKYVKHIDIQLKMILIPKMIN